MGLREEKEEENMRATVLTVHCLEEAEEEEWV